ncbi:MauE/DoxX family redox-associated membrane protein [Tenacibaculum dicentrarchi]|uniref:MauE/DoxX family redox-associated membrane protein n=1 Tax=Tenacibaculum dicentrarchi TaxID=669041 RepID=UPI000C7C95B7|nr:conserved membrane hypothetical protein [Tenacibaculum dicentrarchi]
MIAFLKISKLIIYSLIILFLSYVLANKVNDITSFQTNILKTGLFESKTTIYISYGIILTESIVLLFLVFKKKIGLLLFFIMILMFTLYILFLFYTNRYEICGCGGILNGLSFKYHFLINVSLIGLTYLINKNEN